MESLKFVQRKKKRSNVFPLKCKMIVCRVCEVERVQKKVLLSSVYMEFVHIILHTQIPDDMTFEPVLPFQGFTSICSDIDFN